MNPLVNDEIEMILHSSTGLEGMNELNSPVLSHSMISPLAVQTIILPSFDQQWQVKSELKSSGFLFSCVWSGSISVSLILKYLYSPPPVTTTQYGSMGLNVHCR